MDLNSRIADIFPDESAVPAAFRLDAPIHQREILINGEIRRWDGPMQDSLSPVHLRTPAGLAPKALGSAPLMSTEAALEAAAAAARAYDQGRGRWPTMPVAERIRCIEDFTWRMKQRRADVVKLLMWEIGKTAGDSEKEFDRTIQYIQDTVDALKDLDRVSSRFVIQGGIIGQVRRAPLGVVLSMGPFNYPLNETFTTLIPALIMGNTCVFKPPRHGTLLHRPLLEAFRDAFPPGVVNTIYGEGRKITGPLMASGLVDVLAFIGGSRAADSLKAQHPKPHRLRSVLGLEAKNAAIVLPDADLDLAVKECVLGSLSFNGQRCTALKILFVHDRIVDAFNAALSAEIAKLGVGMPWDPGVSLTPLPEQGKVEWLTGLIADATQKGARVINPCGGLANRTFLYPAVLFPVASGMRLWNEEQFGPVVPVAPFRSIEEPVRYVIDSNYGQQVSVIGRDPDAIADLVDPLVNQVCRVNLNSQCQRGPDTFPFTGRKDSAEGTLSVSDALRVFTIRTLVAAKGTDANKEILSRILRERKSNFLSTDFIL